MPDCCEFHHPCYCQHNLVFASILRHASTSLFETIFSFDFHPPSHRLHYSPSCWQLHDFIFFAMDTRSLLCLPAALQSVDGLIPFFGFLNCKIIIYCPSFIVRNLLISFCRCNEHNSFRCDLSK